jgi:predicted nuclease with RNAse H fold
MAVDRQSRASVAPPERLRAPARPGLTRAEERALRRSTPLTPVQFKALRQLAEQGVSPLRHI